MGGHYAPPLHSGLEPRLALLGRCPGLAPFHAFSALLKIQSSGHELELPKMSKSRSPDKSGLASLSWSGLRRKLRVGLDRHLCAEHFRRHAHPHPETLDGLDN